jgi:hypothetical protein
MTIRWTQLSSKESMTKHYDSDEHKGVVEEESPRATTSHSSMTGQLGHRTPDPDVKDNDSDFPEPGAREEHSGESGS